MAVPSNMLLEAARRAQSANIVPVDEMRDIFEWAWGLERGTFDEHLSSYPDPRLVETLLDDNFIVVAQPDLIGKIYRAVPRSASWRFLSKERVEIQDLYKGCQTFEYLVIPIDTPSAILPRVVLSPIPPHLTVSFAVDKIFKRGDYAGALFRDIVKFVGDASIYGATFSLKQEVFLRLKYVHESWPNITVPRRFLGLEGSIDEEASDGDSRSSTMEWDAHMLPDEPQRRLFPDELKHDPVLKFWTPAADEAADEDEDDAISWDSHITGAGDLEEFAKVSMARGDYLPDRAWMKGVESWVKSTSGIINDQTLTNDGQIEECSDEPPRAVASLDLQKPDFWRKGRPVMRA